MAAAGHRVAHGIDGPQQRRRWKGRVQSRGTEDRERREARETESPRKMEHPTHGAGLSTASSQPGLTDP